MQKVINKKIINIEVLKAWYTVEYVLSRSKALFIFGDNTCRAGMAGQATIRKCFNATGLATKFAPSMDAEAFFNDKNFDLCKYKIDEDIEKIKTRLTRDDYFDTVIFPYDGLGTGLSQLPQRAPKVWAYLCTRLDEEFDITTGLDLKLYINARGKF